MFRQNLYNEGGMGKLIPVGRQQVVPGESKEINVTVMWETPPFAAQILTGGVATLYAFYCPFRLVWPGWLDFVAQDGGTVPTTSTAWPLLYEGGAATVAVSSLFRRCYKLTYNQFFGSDKFGAWYAAVDTDTVVTEFNTRTLDQFNSHVVAQDDAPDPTYVAPVSGANATISLNEFRQAMRNAFSTRRADMTGDKYVDAIARMGVSLDWRVQMAPEFLGKSSVDFFPKRTRVTAENDTAKPVAYFSETMSLKVGRRFFAEHGYIFAVLVVRPHMINFGPGATVPPRYAPQDAYQYDLEDFWLGDNQTGVSPILAGSFNSGAAGVANNGFMPRFGYLKWGQNLAGQISDVASRGNPWCMFDQPSSLNDAVYPDIPFNPNPERDHQVVVCSAFRSDGPSPVKMTF